MNVIVLRGISGSGKTTWAKEKYEGAVVVSADDHFLQEDGTYLYVASEIDAAHEACYRRFMEAVRKKEPLIVVDNTNVTLWEMSPYVMPAQSAGYEVEIVTLMCDPEVAIARKDWLPPDKVRFKHRQLLEEASRMPPFMKRIHTKVQNG